jgi:hypothetical protein
MKSVSFLLLLAAAIALGLGSVSAQAAPRTFHGGGISFTYDDSIFQNPKARHEAAVPDGDASDKIDGVGPAHWAIDFANYRAYLWILPTTDPAVKDFRKTYPKNAQGLRDLRALLKKRPANPKETPVLPFPDIGVAFVTKVQYLDFKNGSGMAWLSQWIYEANPINNEELWYVFQGLTKDEKYYVSGEVRMKHPSLPEKADTRNSQEFSKTYDAYRRKAVPALAKLPDETFQPSLTKLRTMFESIEVTPAP